MNKMSFGPFKASQDTHRMQIYRRRKRRRSLATPLGLDRDHQERPWWGSFRVRAMKRPAAHGLLRRVVVDKEQL